MSMQQEEEQVKEKPPKERAPFVRRYKWRMDRDYIDKKGFKHQEHQILKKEGLTARDLCGEGSEIFKYHKPKVRWSKLPIRWAYDKNFEGFDVVGRKGRDAVEAAFAHYNTIGSKAIFAYDVNNPQLVVNTRKIDGQWNQVGVTYYTWKGVGATAYIQSARITLDLEENWFVSTQEVCGTRGDKLDIQNAFTHELGHAIGLAHSTDKLSSMYPQIRPGETLRRTLSKGDVLGIKTLYKI